MVPLRSWLESNIEVVARGGHNQVLETLPLRLKALDLEKYYLGVTARFREDRAYNLPRVTLEFQYKAAALAADPDRSQASMAAGRGSSYGKSSALDRSLAALGPDRLPPKG